MLVSMSPKVIVKTNILKLCEKLLKEVAKPPKMADLGSPCSPQPILMREVVWQVWGEIGVGVQW